MSQLISIVTPCFNREETVSRTFLSIQNQTYTEFEWVVVDDNSSDSTLEKLYGFALRDHRVKVLVNEGQKGSGGARNHGLQNVRSGLIAFLDADDEWDANFLEEMVPLIINKPSMAFSGFRINRQGKCRDFSPRKIVGADDLLSGSDVSNVTAVYNFGSELKIPEFGTIRARNDLIFMLRALDLIGYATPNPRVLATYYVSPNSISSNKLKLIYWQYKVSRTRGKSVFRSVANVVAWALYGVRKYYFSAKTYDVSTSVD